MAYGLLSVDGDEYYIEWDYCIFCREKFLPGDKLSLHEISDKESDAVTQFASHPNCDEFADQDASKRDIYAALGKLSKWENTQ